MTFRITVHILGNSSSSKLGKHINHGYNFSTAKQASMLQISFRPGGGGAITCVFAFQHNTHITVAFCRTYEEKRLIGRVHAHTQSHAHTLEIIFYLMQVHSNDSTCSTDLKLSNVRYPVVVTYM